MLPVARVVLLVSGLALLVLLESVYKTRNLLATSVQAEAVTATSFISSSDSFQQPPQPTPEVGAGTAVAATSEYTSPLEEFRIPYDNLDNLPGPLAVLEQYKRWHSHDALLSEDDANNKSRTFIVAYYQCPVSAGNWLHYYTSALFYGILTNRTVLWRYVDTETCLHAIVEEFKTPFSKRRCNVTGATEADCASLITRAPWMPSYDEWKARLTLPDPYHVDRKHTQWFERSDEYPFRKQQESSEFVDVFYRDKPVIDINPYAFLRMDYLYYRKELVAMQLGTTYARETLVRLGEFGSPFLFGLLWRYSFDFAPSIRKYVERSLPKEGSSNHDSNNHALSVAMHSRHTINKDDGCNVTLEQAGMLDILQQHRQQKGIAVDNNPRVPCQVTLLSDRVCTIGSLTTWLDEALGCSAIMVQHDAVSAEFNEHGPFSGAGFFQDMLLAGLTVRDGMVGSLEPFDGNRWRSSSELIEESIAYYRTMHHFKKFASNKEAPRLSEMLWSTMDRDAPLYGLKKQQMEGGE